MRVELMEKKVKKKKMKTKNQRFNEIVAGEPVDATELLGLKDLYEKIEMYCITMSTTESWERWDWFLGVMAEGAKLPESVPPFTLKDFLEMFHESIDLEACKYITPKYSAMLRKIITLVMLKYFEEE